MSDNTAIPPVAGVAGEPIAPAADARPPNKPLWWRFTGIAGLKRYLTQSQYEAQTERMKRWYEPVTDDMVMVPRELLDRASQSISAFCGDEGWAQSDMDTLDAIDAARRQA